jgi:hypothetical protein
MQPEIKTLIEPQLRPAPALEAAVEAVA